MKNLHAVTIRRRDEKGMETDSILLIGIGV